MLALSSFIAFHARRTPQRVALIYGDDRITYAELMDRIATTAGWFTAELGRQPWIIHGLLRTADAGSSSVNTGDVVFTLLGFAGLYLLLSLLFVSLVMKELNRGPVAAPVTTH